METKYKTDYAAAYYLVIVNCKMDPFEKIKQIEAELDSLLELKSRSQCQDELYAFALERLEYYRRKNQGKTVPSILKGISKSGEISDELLNSYMEQQYQGFCKYLRDCMDEASVEYEKIEHRNAEWEREHSK